MEAITAHRLVVVANTSRLGQARSYGVQAHQERLTMPGMRVGWWRWIPKTRASRIRFLWAGIRTVPCRRCSGGWKSCAIHGW